MTSVCSLCHLKNFTQSGQYVFIFGPLNFVQNVISGIQKLSVTFAVRVGLTLYFDSPL